MDIKGLLIFLAIGAVAGWVAGMLLKGRSYGLVGNIIVGVIGAILGGYMFDWLDISTGGIAGSIVTATVGAIALVLIVGFLRKV